MSNEIASVKRWLQQVVIDLQLCPFASLPYHQGRVRFSISKALTPESLLTDLHSEINLLQQTPITTVETTLMLVTEMLTDFYDYNQFLAQADVLLVDSNWEGVFQIASFHPNYCFANTAPNDVENLTNRAPYPILHILREESIEKVLENIVSPDDIYKRNIQTVNKLSDTQIKALFPYL
ncbi:MAG: DUF1415 domain-containing protein [Pseudomonadota bacterium]